jgi:hypothetical protein
MHLHSFKQLGLMALVSATALAGTVGLALTETSGADAAVIGFCGNVALGPMSGSGPGLAWCQHELVANYQAYAWGEHSVCVEDQPYGSRACSTGTNGVYSGEVPPEVGVGAPTIHNNTNTVNHASGVYLTH